MAEEEAPTSKEEPFPLFLITANTTQQNKRRKVTDTEKGADGERQETRINIGPAFQRWRKVREQKGFKTDAEFATFLLNSVDCAEDWTCCPDEDKGDVSTSEEEETVEEDGISDYNEDKDYIPHGYFCAGGASKTKMTSDAPESISREFTSHEAVEPTEQLPGGSEKMKVQRNKPYHQLGNQEKSAAESHHQDSTSQNIYLKKTKTEEDHRPETQEQDCSTAPTDVFSASPESTSEHSSFPYETEEIISHQELRRPKKIYKCQTCSRVFPRYNALQRHLVIHSGKRPFKCFICGRGFTQSGNLKTHMKVHRDLPKWTLVQKKSEPKESPATVHVCGDCGMDFPEKHQLEEHRETHKKPYACPDCGKRFKQENSVKIHMRLHSGDSLFFCSACGKSCTTAKMLKIHMLTHTGEKNYHCDQCGRAFSRSSYLKLHLRTHTGERPHLCSICGKRYSRADTLKAHLRVHTGENPYTCKICGKCFYYYQGYQAHVKIHDKKPKTATRPLGRPKQQLIVVKNQ
ncbi:zinc finger protein 2 homolog isoform X2 [Archocentrus centrarchus]|uniref:zinc finger protein 2 homolog isoform X2 n=1 Tax=Archocentrus centrarchus TaxID=63155 RepID=UPI0011E9C283|nr:zinc finger protein 2 homolog isoform X2 [Archocentrus centrarchus]